MKILIQLMSQNPESVLVVGFNTRPLVYSLNKAGFEVYSIDFFGDLDLYPFVKDCLIISDELNAHYHDIKENYAFYLVEFALKFLQTHPKINYLIIGSGLDDNFEEREKILEWIKINNYLISNLNNDIESIRKARDILFVFEILDTHGYKVPITCSLTDWEITTPNIKIPFVLKKKRGAGGMNVHKIENMEKFTSLISSMNNKTSQASNWLIQEYIKGTPVSCTTISNGKECEIVSINRQIIGENFVYTPKEFIYCGNLVPAEINEEDHELIIEISKFLVEKLELKGINGFDFVLKNHYPYLMEINPRIPGSIRVSETALKLNLMNLHVQSFDKTRWKQVKKIIKNSDPQVFATKLIIFAPKDLEPHHLKKINELNHVHDKTNINKKVYRHEPVCTVLYEATNFADSYLGALKIVDEIRKIME
ncbi:MAG: ATP-grasp domain-containing protein [Promethearchaeota archaeon]|nr:MAG: ATP-grasp domain-containing protein [Candidatus Lokiarchaeota archaeon]